jgi:hypothetical protein
MPEPKNFGVVSSSSGEKLAPLRRQVDHLITEIRASEIGPRLAARFQGARPVVLWLPNTRDPDYRARLADQCRRLAELTAEEEAMAAAFEQEAAKTTGWR